MAAFRYLIRFKDVSGKILLGEAGAPKKAETLLGSTVRVYQGSAPWDPNLKLTERTAEVKEVQQFQQQYPFCSVFPPERQAFASTLTTSRLLASVPSI